MADGAAVDAGDPAIPSSKENLSISSGDEWSPLRSVIVGRAEHSVFPPEPPSMAAAVFPAKHLHRFRHPDPAPIPPAVATAAQAELDGLAALLEREGVRVRRPEAVDWLAERGYTGAMPRDALMAVGNHLFESCYAWRSRRGEVGLAFGKWLDELAADSRVVVHRAPAPPDPDPIYAEAGTGWAVTDARPAFDCADFVRLGGKDGGFTLLCQRSNVTNASGIRWVRERLPPGSSVEEVEIEDAHAMHIDTTLLPLRPGLMLYNPGRVKEASLRKLKALDGWRLVPVVHDPDAERAGRLQKEGLCEGDEEGDEAPLYMTSAWLCMNVLLLSENKVLVEEKEEFMARFLAEQGMEVLRLPFRHVYSLGGSFHCATVDLVRG